MEEESAATEAVTNLNGHSVKGRPIKVEKSESKGKLLQKKYLYEILKNRQNKSQNRHTMNLQILELQGHPHRIALFKMVTVL